MFWVDPTPPDVCENMDLPGSKFCEDESISFSQGGDSSPNCAPH